MIIRYNFPSQKNKFRAKSSKNKPLSKNSRISANYGSKCFKNVKQSSRWEKRWFVKRNEKLCELLRRFLSKYFIYLSLNNNIKIPLFERLGVIEVRNIYGKYFVFHMNLAIQEACRILNESIISIEKSSLSNTLWNSYYKGS